MIMINLKNKTALVTGGTRGIGKACVEYFAKAGADVAFTYNSNAALAKEICDEWKDVCNIKSYKVNLLNEDEIKSAVDDAINDFGKIDILVNNAGIWKHGKLDEMTLEQWKETIDVNLTAAFLFTKFVSPFMKKNKFGRIINITSTAGQRGEPEYSHYAASKGGLTAFTKSVAVELGPFNITVNNVAPGWVKTDMTSHVFENPGQEKEIIAEIPLRKVATAGDIAGAVLFLASGLASHITASTISVNGGSVR